MMLLSCSAVRRRLAAFYDRELPVRELISIEAHISECPPCARELRELQALGTGLRLAAAPAPADDWTGLQSGVISRMRAEAHESWTARARRAFDDMHLVWIALASTAATFVCAAAMLSLLHFASPERNDSLAAFIAVMGAASNVESAAPSGSDLNPARLTNHIQVPAVPQSGVVYATLENSVFEQDLELALSAVVSTEGKVSDVEVLGRPHDKRELGRLLQALSNGRLEPAQFGGAPVAVNVVWLVAHTTVKAKFQS